MQSSVLLQAQVQYHHRSCSMQLVVTVTRSPTEQPAACAWAAGPKLNSTTSEILDRLTCGDAGEADGLQAGEHRVGLRERDAAQLDVGACSDVATACRIKRWVLSITVMATRIREPSHTLLCFIGNRADSALQQRL